MHDLSWCMLSLLNAMQDQSYANQRGVQGLKATGVRELTYRLVFLASTVRAVDARIRAVNIRDDGETDGGLEDLTTEERLELSSMKHDPELYQKLVQSLAPAGTLT